MITDTEATKRRMKKQGKDVKIDFVLIDDDENPSEVVRILDNDPVRKLLNRGTITQEQFEAAEKLYSDWYIGGMSPRVTKPFKMMQVDEGSPEQVENDWKIDSLNRAFKAMQFVHAKKLQNVIEEIVLHSKSIREAAVKIIDQNDQNRANAACIELLKVGLDLLAEFYENN